jgi:LysM repeat protein
MPLDPQLEALKNSLTNAISGGQLALSTQTMGSGSLPVTTLFQQAFGQSAITIGGTIRIDPDELNDRLVVSGTAVTTLFRVPGTTIAFTFNSATATTLGLTGTITPPASPVWQFSTSFPNLANTFFGQLLFTTPLFTLSTFVWRNATLDVTIVQGVGLFFRPASLAGPLEPAQQLVAGTIPLRPFYGPVVETATRRTIALAMPFPNVALDLSGFPALSFSQPGLVLRSDTQPGGQSDRNGMGVEGLASFGFFEAPLTIVLPYDEGWILDVFPTEPQSIPSVTGFLALFTGLDLLAALPPAMLGFPDFSLTSLQAQFDLTSGVVSSWGFTITTAPPNRPASRATWPVIPGVLEIRELTLTIQVTIVHPGGIGPAETQISGSIVGITRIGSLDIRVVIPIPVTQEWIFSMANKVVLPGLRELTQLVAGVDLNTLVPAGVGNIGGFTLSSVVLRLDPVKPAILSFGFALASTSDWIIIPGRLAIKNLLLTFNVEQPFSTRILTGTVYGTLGIGSWDIGVTVSREPFETDWSMLISADTMPLPSIADLDQLANTSLAPYLPQTLATASFTVYSLLIDLNLSQRQIRQLAFQLESDQAWTIMTDVLVIERVGLYVDLSWFSGDLLANFGVWGDLEVVTKRIKVSADRLGAGSWTFRGALAEGETISLTGLVGQFLPFVPKYLPTLEVEGLAVSFTTPSNDFAIEGRTAGFWTFEVSTALTLKLRASAAFRRVKGQQSGELRGDFFVNSLEIIASYAFDATSKTLTFQFIYGRFNLTAALTSGTNAKGQEFSLLSFRLGDLSFGEILTALINMAAPGREFTLEPPWDALNQINLRNLSLVVDLKTRDVTVTYDISVNLVFIVLTGVGLKYDRSRGEGSVTIALSGRFLNQEYSVAQGNPLEWDVLNEPPPSVPAKGPSLFELRYLGLGQHVSFTNIKTLNTVGEVITALRAQMTKVNDATRNPLASGNGSSMRFDRASGVLLGADFTVLSTLSTSFIFNDPYLYGMRIALAGERAGSLAGLAFELLYKRITNDIGVFKIELRVPDAFRQFEFGAVSITLPVIRVDVYTNGNFRVDLGFPRNGDFSDSFCVQVFPFIGYGGFYFAALTGATSERVPLIGNGTFAPVIEFGIGLQVGLGKEIRKGPLSGGIYVTVMGILEGSVAWFTPTGAASSNGLYYWIEGIVGIVGKVYGTVDFAVIKVSVRLEARLTVRLVLEAYEATHVEVSVDVEAEATVTIFFIDISFSFKLSLREEFVIGSASTPPWTLAQGDAHGEQPRLRMQRTQWRRRSRLREQRLRTYSIPARTDWLPWDPILVFATKHDLPLSLLPALTVATPPQSNTPALQIDFLLLAENAVAPGARARADLRHPTAAHSSRTNDPMTLSFNLLTEAMLMWSIYSVTGSLTGNVTAGDLERAYTLLASIDTIGNGFSSDNLQRFFAANFNVQISGLPLNVDQATQTSSTVMAMLPPLSYTFGNTTIDFSTHNPVSPTYEEQIRLYYEQLLVDFEYGRAIDPAAPARGEIRRVAETVGGDESMATVIFREYMLIVARAAVQAARDTLTTFLYPVTATDSLNTIVAKFPTVVTPAGTLAVTPESVAWANRDVIVTPATPWTLKQLMYQVNGGDSLTAIAVTRFGLSNAANLMAVAANAANRQLLATGATVTIAQPASTDATWFNYTSVAGDGLAPIAVWAFARALPADPLPNGAWYAQTIGDFNTDPLHPYAGPDLTGVIATGTSLLVPAALDDSDRTHAITYVTRAGDTLALVAAYFDVLQNAPQSLLPIETGLQTLNPGVNWPALPAGTIIKVPAQQYVVASGDSFNAIAARFLIAATDLAFGPNASSTTLLAPLAVLALPDVVCTTGSSDTFAKVAERFNTTVADIANSVATVPAIFRYPVSLRIPDVPAYPRADLVAAVINGHGNEVAMATSRFMASGLRLPVPGQATPNALYALTGQQVACPTTLPATFTFATTAPWITFADSVITSVDDSFDILRARHARVEALNPALWTRAMQPGLHVLTGEAANLVITITQTLLDTYAPSTTFDPHITGGPAALDIKQRTPVSYRLDRNLHWQTPVAVPFGGTSALPTTGEPSIWLFSQALEERASALGWGTTAFALFTAGDNAIATDASPVLRYNWATIVNISVRQTAATQGAGSLPNTYEIAGSDADGKARLLALLDYLTNPAISDTAQVYILYTPNADTNNPNGLASASLTAASTFLLRTNLATITASGPHSAVLRAAPAPNLYAAPIDQGSKFIQLLWEAAVTASGGYILNYVDAAGNGLPASIFASTPLGQLRVVVILGSQSAATPDRKLYAFNNCAVVGDNLDASAQTVFVDVSEAAKVQWRESASIPPGNVGFTLARTNPGAGNTPALRTQKLYSLLAYQSVAVGNFRASNEGLPISPDRPDNVADADETWHYSHVLRLARLATAALPQAAFLPSAATDPYAGIGDGSTLTMSMAFHDLYGNDTISSAPIANLLIPVGYFDDVVGLAQWPGIAASYEVTQSGNAPALTIGATLQVSNYVPGGGTSFVTAQRNTSAHLTRLQTVYYQMWQSDVTLTLTTSLVQSPGAAPTPFTVDRVPFANFVSAACIFLATTQRFQQATQTIGNGTLLTIAQGLSPDARFVAEAIAAIGETNQDTPTASIFAASLALPQFYTAAFGDSLARIVQAAGAPPITVVQLATANAGVALNAGTDLAAPTRTSAPATATTKLRDVATAMSADVGAIGIANATTQGLLAEGAELTVGDATVAVGVDPDSHKTWSFADLAPHFADLGVTATPAIIAVANQDRAGILAVGQTLTIADYVIEPGDTFTSLQNTWPAFTISALATAAAASPNLFVAGTPLFIRQATPVPPSATQTLRTLADSTDLTVAQIASANQQTALVATASIALPDRVTIAASADTVVPYTTPAAGLSINAIVQTFAEADALTFATRNWELRYIFVPLQTIAIGNASTPTAAADSFGSVYDRLHAQDASITRQLYVDTIAPSTTLVRQSALFATILPSTGATVTSLQTLGTTFGCDPLLLAQVNASLVGFLAAGVTVTLGALSLVTGAQDTLTSLVQRFGQSFDVQTTVADVAAANVTKPIIASQRRFVLPPAALAANVTLPSLSATPAYPGNPFRLVVDLTIARSRLRIDPQFATVPAVAAATTRLSPRLTAIDSGGALSLEPFARTFEGVYTKLKVAVGGDASGGSGTQDVWLVNFGTGGVTSIAIDGTRPSFFALPPLATSLQDLTGVAIRTYDAVTGKLVPAMDPPTFDFQAVDLDVWAALCFGAIEQILSPAYAAPAYRINPTAFTQLVGAKQRLADRVSAGVLPILSGSSGVKADAVARLRQQLLANLSSGYATSAIVQYPVQVASTFGDALTAPRLVSDLLDDLFKTGATEDIATVATFYAVPQAAIAMLLADTVRILAVGTTCTFKSIPFTILETDTIGGLVLRLGATGIPDFVANLDTPNGFFAPYTVLNIDRVEGKSGDATPNPALLTFADLVDYFHTPLPLLATSLQAKTGLFREGETITVPDHGSIVIGSQNNSLALAAAALHFDPPYRLAEAITLQTGLLDPQFTVGVVRVVPQHTLSSTKISLYNGATTLNSLFSVKSAARARNMFLRVDAHINELEYDIVPVANEFDASRWLSFVVPIAQTTTPLKTDLGEVLIPIPLRAYPPVPSMIEQGGRAAVEAPADVAHAKQWRYAYSYQSHLASQDTLYVNTTFNVPLSASVLALAAVPPLWAALAQFSTAWTDVSSALTALLTWTGASNPVLAQTMQTFADMASDVANGWTGAMDDQLPALPTTYAYELHTTVRSSADGQIDYLDTLRVTVLSGAGPSPTGTFPTIEWRRPNGDWLALDLQSHTTRDAVYLYRANVDAADTVQHRLTFDQLDVTAWQNASGSTRLTRNEHLVSSAATTTGFVYGTSAIGFAQPAVPLIQHDDVIVFNNGMALQQAIAALFTTLLGTTSPNLYWIKLSVEFGYEIIGTAPPAQPLVSFLPIGFLPASPYDATVPTRVYQLIADWRSGKPFGPTQGLFAIDVTVFTTLTPASSTNVPILRLPHLVYDNSDAPPAASLASRLWSRPR